MNKQAFISEYLGAEPKIRVFFNTETFLEDESITVGTGSIPANVARRWYVPKYDKAGSFDSRLFPEQVSDDMIAPVSLARAALNPALWDLEIAIHELPDPRDIAPVPVAHDTHSGHALLLDSNHTISNLLNLGLLEQVPVVTVHGAHLERLVPDFVILNRHTH